MKTALYNLKGEKIGEIDLPDEYFNLEFNPDLAHQAMRWQLANSYFPYAHTKTRSEVRGSNKKPWSQKGTGRARHGSRRSPIWVGGGVTFGPRKEKNRELKINKKMKRKAILMILSEKLRGNFLKVIDNFDFEKPKTKEIEKFLSNFLQERKTKKKKETALIALEDNKKELIKAIRNLPYANTLEARNLNVLALLNHKYIFLTPKTIEVIKKTFDYKK
ncbi:MAG: 50S ribosomal protein L4 [Patescibacteria group bacterium]